MPIAPKLIRTPTLEIAYQDAGPADAPAVVLLHGFPYDPHTYDDVVPKLVQAGLRVLVPYLRGYGPTRFLDPQTLRSGQQAALGKDLLDLLDALGLQQAIVSGYDWGGRAACIVAALWPERVGGLRSGCGEHIQDIAGSVRPASPDTEARYWYQYYFHTARGVAGLTADRRALCRFIWQLWSPSWRFDEAIFERSAASFDNPDFVDVVIQSYRHRFGYCAGDPALELIEQQLAAQPPITVPTIVLHGADDGVQPPAGSSGDAAHFTARYARRVIPGCGHNLPLEAPEAWARAVLELQPGAA